MKLIVGLGNPSKKYQNTRHNVGFMLIDALKKESLPGVILRKSRVFMNQSGQEVQNLIQTYYTNEAMAELSKDLWIIHDDIDIPLGKFKIQKNRGAAGHKGVQSIIDELGTKDFNRIRIGICPASGKSANVEDFVLQKFTKEEKETLQKLFQQLNRALPILLKSDLNRSSV